MRARTRTALRLRAARRRRGSRGRLKSAPADAGSDLALSDQAPGSESDAAYVEPAYVFDTELGLVDVAPGSESLPSSLKVLRAGSGLGEEGVREREFSTIYSCIISSDRPKAGSPVTDKYYSLSFLYAFVNFKIFFISKN